MKKILVVTYEMPPQHSGAGVDIKRTYEAIVEMYPNIYVEILSLKGPSQISDFSKNIIIKRSLSRWDANKVIDMLIDFFKVIRSIVKADIIHLNALYPIGLLVIPIANFLRKKTILQLHCMGVDDPKTVSLKKYGKLLSFFYKKAQYFKTYSKAQSDALVESGVNINRILEIPPYIDNNVFFPIDSISKNEFKKSIGLSSDAIVLTTIGRIGHRKGSDIVLDVFSALNDKIPKLELIMVGPHNNNVTLDYPENLKLKIQKNTNKKIKYLGERKDVNKILQITDYFILPSRGEGFGIVNIEALACGAVVVVSNLKGIFDTIIDHYKDGLIVTTFDYSDYVDAIFSLHNDIPMREMIVKNGFKKVQKKYAKEVTLKPYINFIFETL
jgi:glycosyltransferase involved in cell wall biosynthesis